MYRRVSEDRDGFVLHHPQHGIVKMAKGGMVPDDIEACRRLPHYAEGTGYVPAGEEPPRPSAQRYLDQAQAALAQADQLASAPVTDPGMAARRDNAVAVLRTQAQDLRSTANDRGLADERDAAAAAAQADRLAASDPVAAANLRQRAQLGPTSAPAPAPALQSDPNTPALGVPAAVSPLPQLETLPSGPSIPQQQTDILEGALRAQAGAADLAYRQGNQAIDAARASQEKAGQAATAASAAEAAARDPILSDYRAQQKFINDQVQQSVTRYQSDVSQLKDAINNGRIDPNRLWSSKTSGQKALAIIGIVLGGFANGGNPAIKLIEDHINRDVSAQQADIENKQNLLRSLTMSFGNEQAALDHLRAGQEAYFRTALEGVANQYAGTRTAAAAQQALAQLDAQSISSRVTLAQNRAQNAIQVAQQRASIAIQRMVIAQGQSSIGEGGPAAGVTLGSPNASGDYADNRKRMVTGTIMGRPIQTIGRSEKTATDASDRLAALENARTDIHKLYDLSQQISALGAAATPQMLSAIKTQYQVVQNHLVQILPSAASGLNRMTGMEGKAGEQMSGTILANKLTGGAGLGELNQILNNEVAGVLRAEGASPRDIQWVLDPRNTPAVQAEQQRRASQPSQYQVGQIITDPRYPGAQFRVEANGTMTRVK